MLKKQGHTVKFAKGRKKLYEKFDEIYITTLFTFWYKITIETILFYKHNYKDSKIRVGGIFASLMPEYIKKYTGIDPHFGLIKDAEEEAPDYSLVNSDVSICFTSRGCIRKCGFCIVPKVEGSLKDVNNWINNIDTTKPIITFWDNNWFAKGIEKVKKDVVIIRGLVKAGVTEIDFNQGLDVRLFNEDFAKALQGLPIKPMRFAFDNMTEDGYIQKAIDICQNYGLTKKQKWCGNGSPVTIYTLYNFKDTPADFYYRIREIIKHGGMPFPMQYSPHDDLNRKFVGEHWNLTQRNAVKKLTNNLGQISSETREEFEYFWGKNEKEFLARVSLSFKEIAALKTKRKINSIRSRMGYDVS